MCDTLKDFISSEQVSVEQILGLNILLINSNAFKLPNYIYVILKKPNNIQNRFVKKRKQIQLERNWNLK